MSRTLTATASRKACVAALALTSLVGVGPFVVNASAATVTTVKATTSASKVSANTATKAQITAALTAAGVTNAARWAKEVIEYRTYPKSDPTLAKLRQNLAKYNPGQATVDKIISVLKP